MSWKGIANAKRVKSRPKSKRGGQVAADDGLDYGDPFGMPLLSCSFLEYMAVVNFAPRTIASRGKDLQAFFHWCQERDLVRADAITNQSSKPISGSSTVTGKRTASRLASPRSKAA